MTVFIPARSLVPWIAGGSAVAVVLLIALIVLIGRDDGAAAASAATTSSPPTSSADLESTSSTTQAASSLLTHAELGGRFGYGDAVAGTIEVATDFDRWAFQGNDDDVVTVTMTPAEPSTQIYLEVYDQGGWRRAYSECNIELARILNLQLNGDGAFTVHAGTCADSTGSYELTLIKKVSSGIIQDGGVVRGELTIADDYDTWMYDGTKDEYVTVTMTAGDTAQRVYLEIFDEGGWRRAYADCSSGTAQVLNYEIGATGVYYVHAGSCDASTGPYDLGLLKQ